MSDGERMMELLQRWGQQRSEVRFVLHHERAPGHDTGKKQEHGACIKLSLYLVYLYLNIRSRKGSHMLLLFMGEVLIRDVPPPHSADSAESTLLTLFKQQESFFIGSN